jgi:hypothetical protein
MSPGFKGERHDEVKPGFACSHVCFIKVAMLGVVATFSVAVCAGSTVHARELAGARRPRGALQLARNGALFQR